MLRIQFNIYAIKYFINLYTNHNIMKKDKIYQYSSEFAINMYLKNIKYYSSKN